MTEPVYLNDHVLVVGEDRGERTYVIECPYVDREQKRWLNCGCWEQCPCEKPDGAYHRTLESLAQLAKQVKLDYDPEADYLELVDWIEGCTISTEFPGVKVQIVAHQECDATEVGLHHYEWEGELGTSTGPCCFLEVYREVGIDLIDHLDPPGLALGRHPIRGEGPYEDFEVELINR